MRRTNKKDLKLKEKIRKLKKQKFKNFKERVSAPSIEKSFPFKDKDEDEVIEWLGTEMSNDQR